MDSRRAAVADSGDESQGRDACMDHLDRSRARIDRSACAPRAAHTCPRTWTNRGNRAFRFYSRRKGPRVRPQDRGGAFNKK